MTPHTKKIKSDGFLFCQKQKTQLPNGKPASHFWEAGTSETRRPQGRDLLSDGDCTMAIPYPKQANGSARVRHSPPARPALRVIPGGAGSPSNDGYSQALRRFHDVSARSHLKAGQLTPNVFVGPSVSYGQPLQKPPPVFRIPDTNTGTSYLSLGTDAARKAAAGLAALQALAVADAIVNTITALPGYQGIGPVPGHGFWRRTHGPFFYGGSYTNGPGGSAEAYRPNEAYYWQTGQISGQAIAYRGDGNLTPIPSDYQFGIWWRHDAISRFAQHSAWVRVGTAAEATKLTKLSALPGALVHAAASTRVPTWADPLATPIGGVAFAPATPYALIPKLVENPFRATAYQTVRGYAAPGLTVAPGYGIGITPGVYPGITPGISPGVGGATDPAINPGFPGMGWGIPPVPPLRGIVNPVSVLNPVAPRPPGKGVTESKWLPMGKGAAAAILTGVSFVTETLDVIGAAWKALPKSHKTGYYELHYRDPVTGEIKTYYKFRHKASLPDKIADLVAGAGVMDPQAFLSNMVDEAIEDRIYGGVGQLAQKGRAKGYRDAVYERNADRAKQGRQYRKYVPREKYPVTRRGPDGKFQRPTRSHDYGPGGRGYTTGPGL